MSPSESRKSAAAFLKMVHSSINQRQGCVLTVEQVAAGEAAAALGAVACAILDLADAIREKSGE